MTVQITIRDVPESVRAELERLVTRPPAESWLAAVRERKAAAGTRVDAATILKARNVDRR